MNIKDLEDIERLERLEETLVELKELADSGAIIVVEGKKDVYSLNLLGITGDIRQATLYPLLDFTESMAKSGKEIILLTDWDTKGGILAKKIRNHLAVYGIMPNKQIRSSIRNLVKKRIKDVESLSGYAEKLRYEVRGEMPFNP
jgi:5S rRNA maturation endonuclease (ribonuclease M5)